MVTRIIAMCTCPHRTSMLTHFFIVLFTPFGRFLVIFFLFFTALTYIFCTFLFVFPYVFCSFFIRLFPMLPVFIFFLVSLCLCIGDSSYHKEGNCQTVC